MRKSLSVGLNTQKHIVESIKNSLDVSIKWLRSVVYHIMTWNVFCSFFSSASEETHYLRKQPPTPELTAY